MLELSAAYRTKEHVAKATHVKLLVELFDVGA
jgi:hypothetical protein